MAKLTAKARDGLTAANEPSQLAVEERSDENVGRTLARLTLDPQTRNLPCESKILNQKYATSQNKQNTKPGESSFHN